MIKNKLATDQNRGSKYPTVMGYAAVRVEVPSVSAERDENTDFQRVDG